MADWLHQRPPPANAVWKEWQLSGDRRARTLAHLRHPGYAFEGEVSVQAVDQDLQGLARVYLRQWEGLDPCLKEACDALDSSPKAPLQWLPVAWGLAPARPEHFNPVTSFVVARGSTSDVPTRGTFVLLAARVLGGSALGDGVGLRLLAHAVPIESDRWRVGFSGFACSNLDHVNQPLPALLQQCQTTSRGETVRQSIANALALKFPAVHAVEVLPTNGLSRLSGVGLRTRKLARHEFEGHTPRPLTFSFEVDVDPQGQVVHIESLEECGARMTNVRLFDRDPASMGPPTDLEGRAPGLSALALDRYRVDAPLDHDAALFRLERPGLFYVRHETAVDGQLRPGKTVGPTQSMAALELPSAHSGAANAYPPVHSDDLSAVQAFTRASEFFERLDAYGLNAWTYFRHARLPMVLRPRSPVGSAMDGEDVNAEVRPIFLHGTVPELDLLSALRPRTAGDLEFAPNRRPQLLVKLGSAEASRRDGEQTLGIAADPRWTWHEFGHVLNYAATGELELPFAHSAGDALAAIACDPDSGLASSEEMRGHTFPWVFAPRRHDRHVSEGHCWCGQLNLTRLLRDPPKAHYRHDYFGEELLSSSLFRLYRSLGGDTGCWNGEGAPDEADLAIRRSASDYCVYLIMRAIALLGPNGVAPARTADQYVAALIDADLGTGQWSVHATWPFAAQQVRHVQRQGGRVHKVIRWAFEQQGLYATDAPGVAVDAVGLPPPVDVYIADARAASADEGGYAPVPLRWIAKGSAPWHARADAITREGQTLTVRWRQRGQRQASAANVAFWFSTVPTSGDLSWKRLDTVQPMQPGQATSVPFDSKQKNRAWWVFVQIDCDEDPSNLAYGQEPPSASAELLELVAHDNNLGLAYLAP